MNKKLFKKMLTAVLTAALLLTSNGVASLNASAAENENILVKGVYTNVEKITMATQTTRQINAYVEPSDATIQSLQYKSSAPEVAKVSSTGLITALSPGKATITVSATDGSKQKDTITVTVLKDLIITKDHVDSDNEVIIIDKTYGNITIDSSVGDADIYFGGVTVRNILAMDNGEYSLFLYDSKIKEIKIDDVVGEIESFAATDTDSKAPNLVIGENTQINDLNARISASIRQEDGSAIEGLRVTQSADGKITVYLENYNGGLLLDTSLGDMEIITIGSTLSNVNVTGSVDSGIIELTNGGDSQIDNLTVSGSANVNLGLPANEVSIDRNAQGASLTANDEIRTLNNFGTGSNISITGMVDNLENNGDNANIDVASGGFVAMINLNGEGSSLSGEGDVSEAYVNADNCSINTVNTLVVVGEANGTSIQGETVLPGTTKTSPRPAPVGGGGIVPPKPAPILPGDVILDNNFEDRKTQLLNDIQGTVTISIVNSGDPERGYVAKVSNKQAEWAGAGFDLTRYCGKYITLAISAKIMALSDGEVKATIKYNGDQYTQPEGCKADALANTWTELNGTFLLNKSIRTAVIYFEAPSAYYLDDVLITVADVGMPIPAESVTINETDIVLNINESKQLTVTVEPAAADVKTVTWSSSDQDVATVDENGIVKGIGAGTATITATSNCPYAKPKPEASVEVEVVDVVVIDLNKNYIFFTAVGETETLSAGEAATWTSSNEAVATVSESGVVTAVGNGTAIITANIPGGVGTCKVNVELQPEDAIVFDFDDETVGTAKSFSGAGKATIALDPTAIGSTNKVLKVEPSGYSQFAYVEVNLPEGKKLGDYTSLIGKIHLKQGDVGYKSLIALAGENISDLSLSHEPTPSQIGASDTKSGNEVFEPVTIEFTTMSSALRNLSGTIVLGFGIHCAGTGSGDGLPTIYYLDELVLVPYTGDPVAIEGVTLNKSTLTLSEGKTEQLVATIVPNNYTTSGEITWTSSDPTVATVDSTGKVTAVKEGNATITAKTAIDGVSVVSYEADCAVTVTPAVDDPTVEVVFETGYEDGDVILQGDGGIFTVVSDVKHSGEKSMMVETTANWNGVQYTLDNSAGTEPATYTVSAYVRKVNDEDVATVRYVMANTPYTQFGTLNLTTEWQKFEVDIPVDAGTLFAIRLAPVDEQPEISYYVDDIKITKTVDEPSAPDIYFEDFYIAYEESLGVEEYNKYLDGENFKYIAQSGGVTGDTLNKFLSWEGIKEVVKSIEITIEISSAQAVTGASIQVDTLMQNKVDDNWSGSYMIQTDDTGLEIISEPYKIYRSIILSDEYWNEYDTITGKISAKLNNLKEGTNVEATITIKVTSNTK